MFLEFPEFSRNIPRLIENFFEFIINWLRDSFRFLWDFIRELLLDIFFGSEFVFTLIPWWLLILIVFGLGWYLKSWLTGLTLALMLFTIGLLGLWEPMQATILIVFISVLISFIIGIPFGILMAKSNITENIMKPILDGMQTMPSFVYLIPAIMFFNHGIAPAIIASTIYAVPPITRLTYLGIKNVSKEVVEAGLSFGSTPAQMLFKIEIPQALPTIMTGLNQTTMMAMAMVVISSMIGAPGIGDEVFIAVTSLQVGRGIKAGIAIVFLAIIIDRLLQGVANKLEKAGG